MKIAVISFTEKGRTVSEKISSDINFGEIVRFCFYKHSDDGAEKFDDIKELIKNIFGKYDALIFVSACGIAVRAVSPHIVSKQTDPAVVTVDDCGKFAVPILSGHLGGANALAEFIAEKTGAQAVITTATDCGKIFSPDSFARANGLMITDMKAAKEIAAALLDGEKIGFESSFEYVNMPPYICCGNNFKKGICVSADTSKKPFETTLLLVPVNVAAGIGCKKNTTLEQIENAVSSAFEKNGVDPVRIFAAATVDIKANEKGLVGFCEKRKIPLFSYAPSELMELDGDFTRSDFVKSITGTDNVCERSAVKCSGGNILFRKTAVGGVTVSAAEKKIILDFEGKIL